MMIFKHHLSRRTVLRGLGTSLALPLLDAMVPAAVPLRATAAKPAKRFAAIYTPHGAGDMSQYTPPSEGALQIMPAVGPLEPFREQMLIASGLDCRKMYVQDGGPHPRAQTTWLTGTTAKYTEGPDIRAGVSLDQMIARETARETQIASLELAVEPVELIGACALGYSCAYTNTISWRTETTPQPMENNPRAVFERLFGASDSTDQRSRAADIAKDRSILDSVNAEIASLRKRVGSADQRKVNDYLDSVRDVERRIQKAEQQIERELPTLGRPVGIPPTFEEHVSMLFDLLALAFQVDLTRVSTLLMSRENSNRAYTELGIPDAHHSLSHHQDNPEKVGRLFKIYAFHTRLFAGFLEKLRDVQDGDGSLLDHSLFLYGSGMSNPNLHDWTGVPTMVVAGRDLGVGTGRHLRAPAGTPLANLQLALLRKMDVPATSFGDSSGVFPI